MNIPNNRFSSTQWGLPSESDIAALAATYFPEFSAGEIPASPAGVASPSVAAVPANPAGPDADDHPVPAREISANKVPVYSPLESAENISEAYSVAPPTKTGATTAAHDSSREASNVAAYSTTYSPVVISENSPNAKVPCPRANRVLHAVASYPQPAPAHTVGLRSVESIREDFPILSEKVNGGQNLIWFDNAATTQRPRAVIDRISHYYEKENSNVHRGAHELAARSTNAYEEARNKVARFVGAPSADNIVFVRGTTEGINLVAQAFVKPQLSAGDEIILTILEHHANIVPWQMIAAETGAVLRVAPIDRRGHLILSEYEKLFNSRTKFVSAAHVSNALGTITPVAELVQIAHAHGVRILIDGAQSISHIPVNVVALDADFFVFSGHKIFGPTGIGALYGKSDVLEEAQPYQGGGNMIADVTFERTLYHKAPLKFEAGTGNIADAVGLGAALDYVSSLGIENIAAWEHELLRYGMQELEKIPGLRLIGTADAKASVISFVIAGQEIVKIGQHLSNHGIAVRAGHHCAQPVHRFFGLEGTVRPSFAFYNTPEEIDKMVDVLKELVEQ